MSRQHKSKRGNKIRLNLTLSRSAVEAGKRIAELENRSFSNTIEVLLERANKPAEETKPLAA